MEDIAVDSIMEAVIDRSIDSIDLGDIEIIIACEGTDVDSFGCISLV